jgi:hypothetical protein
MKKLGIALALLIAALSLAGCLSDTNASNPSVYTHPPAGGTWGR